MRDRLIRHFAECYPWVWRPADVDVTPACFTTSRASNGGTEVINGVIELHRRIAAASATSTTTG
jgi:hypothetical protein